jgi:hypothetical protein
MKANSCFLLFRLHRRHGAKVRVIQKFLPQFIKLLFDIIGSQYIRHANHEARRRAFVSYNNLFAFIEKRKVACLINKVVFYDRTFFAHLFCFFATL